MTYREEVRTLIKRFEGVRYKAYQDSVGIWTIGVGHTGPEVKPGLVWTEAQVNSALDLDIDIADTILHTGVQRGLPVSIRKALTSFIFNVGPGGKTKDGFLRLRSGRSSTIRRLVNEGLWLNAADELLKWDKGTVGGVLVRIAGLTNRRRIERDIFLSEQGQWPHFLSDLGSESSDL